MKRILYKLAIAIPFVAIIIFSIHPLQSINQDIGRHLKTGEIIWQTKSIPETNLFSYTEPEHPFTNHHWLSEVAFYGLENLVGLKGMIVVKALIITLAFYLSFLGASTLFNKRSALIALAISFPLFSARTDLRPEMFSYLFIGLIIFLVSKYIRTKDIRYLYALPIIQILWTNSHIYFPLGIGIIALIAITQIANKQTFKTLLIVAGICILATFINPHGIKGALEPLTILNQYGYSVAENQSISTLSKLGLLKYEIVRFQYLIIVILAATIIYIRRRKQFPWRAFVILTPFVIMSAMMIRNFGPTAIVMVFGMTPLIYFGLGEMNIDRKKLGIWFTIWILITISFIGTFGRQALAQNGKLSLDIPKGSQAAVDFIKVNNVQGPMFNNFDIGSFLIWKLYPDHKVFVDGRPEAYSVKFFQEVYIPMQESSEIWNKYSEQYGINYIVFDLNDGTPWGQTFTYLIQKNPKWVTIFKDERTIVLIKEAPANKDLISRYSLN